MSEYRKEMAVSKPYALRSLGLILLMAAMLALPLVHGQADEKGEKRSGQRVIVTEGIHEAAAPSIK